MMIDKFDLKVGTKVKIRDDLVDGNVYGKETFVKSMNGYKGQIVTIAHVRPDHNMFYICDDNQRWAFTPEMIEKIIYDGEDNMNFKKLNETGPYISREHNNITIKQEPSIPEGYVNIVDSGERTSFTSGAVRDMHEGKGRFDLLPMCVLLRLAKHYENGAIKYEERNWEKGIPAHSFADSAMRHLVKYMDGWTDEDHLIAAIWNLCGLAWTEEKKPELIDIPSRTRK